MAQGEEKDHIRRLISAIDRAYHHPGQLVWRGFLIGLASGAGGVIGAVLIVALIGFLIRLFGGLPGIGDWLTNVGQELPRSRF